MHTGPKHNQPIEPHTDFDWDKIYQSDESGITSDEQEAIKHLLLFIIGYIFYPSIKGGRRSNQEQIISNRTLAMFSVLLQPYLNNKGSLHSIWLTSGLKIKKRAFYAACKQAEQFILDKEKRNR